MYGTVLQTLASGELDIELSVGHVSVCQQTRTEGASIVTTATYTDIVKDFNLCVWALNWIVIISINLQLWKYEGSGVGVHRQTRVLSIIMVDVKSCQSQSSQVFREQYLRHCRRVLTKNCHGRVPVESPDSCCTNKFSARFLPHVDFWTQPMWYSFFNVAIFGGGLVISLLVVRCFCLHRSIEEKRKRREEGLVW